ncbi:DeoB protein [Candidatus Pantoea carbekii]|uniref:Phosphopentomutase n=1 Tax=Candidatus Pantoea carbekii TaxID=1235990 RepID=U3U7D2_9GAMM|nr:DeoB protein [Candidatus Pantoea carbekii]
MKRVFIMVLDSFGIGCSKDSEKFGDQGADTLGHIADVCFQNFNHEILQAPFYLPNLNALGLGKAAKISTGRFPTGLNEHAEIIGAYGCAGMLSSGKDTPSGHWEMAGVPIMFDWHYFLDQENSFPKFLLKNLIKKANLPGYLGNCHSSGTLIINELGEEHIKTGKPIFYTSSDSVFQIACHEKFFGLTRLYQLSKIVRQELIDAGYNICRVIARPFIGEKKHDFRRTGNRQDFVVEPPLPTILKKFVDEKNGEVIAVGKIADIYARQGITQIIKANGLENLLNATITQIKKISNDSIIFTNFVDFDSIWGHRRDIAGYANGLKFFDSRLPELMALVQQDDILILTADHGCDPSWHGTNHTREHVPILLYGPNIQPRSLGYRDTLADIAQTIASYFSLSKMQYGTSMLQYN